MFMLDQRGSTRGSKRTRTAGSCAWEPLAKALSEGCGPTPPQPLPQSEPHTPTLLLTHTLTLARYKPYLDELLGEDRYFLHSGSVLTSEQGEANPSPNPNL